MERYYWHSSLHKRRGSASFRITLPLLLAIHFLMISLEIFWETFLDNYFSTPAIIGSTFQFIHSLWSRSVCSYLNNIRYSFAQQFPEILLWLILYAVSECVIQHIRPVQSFSHNNWFYLYHVYTEWIRSFINRMLYILTIERPASSIVRKVRSIWTVLRFILKAFCVDLSVKQFTIDKWLCLSVQRNLLPSFLIQPQLVWLFFFLFSIAWLYMTSYVLSIHFWNYFYFIWYLFLCSTLFCYICYNYSNCIFNFDINVNPLNVKNR